MLRSVSALVRFVVGGAAILAWATPAATQSVFTCNGSPASCSVGAGTYTSPASVSIQSPNFSADNAGTFNVTASPTTLGAITVQSVSTAINFDGNPSGGFSFTNSNAVTFTGPSSLGTTSTVYGGVTLKSQGAPGTDQRPVLGLWAGDDQFLRSDGWHLWHPDVVAGWRRGQYHLGQTQRR